MKKLLKIIAVSMALATVFTVSAFAGGDQPNLPDAGVQQEEVKPAVEQEEAQPSTVPCVYCDVGTMVQADSYSTDWLTVDYIPCQCEGGHAPMQDRALERIDTVAMTCGSCGLSKIETSVQSRTEHME